MQEHTGPMHTELADLLVRCLMAVDTSDWPSFATDTRRRKKVLLSRGPHHALPSSHLHKPRRPIGPKSAGGSIVIVISRFLG